MRSQICTVQLTSSSVHILQCLLSGGSSVDERKKSPTMCFMIFRTYFFQWTSPVCHLPRFSVNFQCICDWSTFYRNHTSCIETVPHVFNVKVTQCERLFNLKLMLQSYN